MPTKTCPYCIEEIQAEATRCKHCNAWLPGPVPGQLFGPTYFDTLGSRRLVRSSTNRMFSGVCGGLGAYLGIDPTLLRVLVALVTFFTAVAPGVIVYIILAFVIPEEGDATLK